MSESSFLLDSNVFIEAHKRYYNYGICPGFWKALKHHLSSPVALSIDKVKDELVVGNDDLARWVTSALPSECFAITAITDVVTRYAELQNWAVSQHRYTPNALHEFADSDKADAWLIAFAKVKGRTIVTHEGNDPAKNNRVLIPIVCRAFDIPVIDTFVMLHELEVKLDWAPKAV